MPCTDNKNCCKLFYKKKIQSNRKSLILIKIMCMHVFNAHNICIKYMYMVYNVIHGKIYFPCITKENLF